MLDKQHAICFFLNDSIVFEVVQKFGLKMNKIIFVYITPETTLIINAFTAEVFRFIFDLIGYGYY